MAKYRITSVDYDVTTDDVEGTGETVRQVLARLPQSLIVELEDDPEELPDEVNLHLAGEVMNITGWLINNLEYEEIG